MHSTTASVAAGNSNKSTHVNACNATSANVSAITIINTTESPATNMAANKQCEQSVIAANNVENKNKMQQQDLVLDKQLATRSTAGSLRRQPTIYPQHGVNISIETVKCGGENEQQQQIQQIKGNENSKGSNKSNSNNNNNSINNNNNSSSNNNSSNSNSKNHLNSNSSDIVNSTAAYSRASTLRSSWDCNNDAAAAAANNNKTPATKQLNSNNNHNVSNWNVECGRHTSNAFKNSSTATAAAAAAQTDQTCHRKMRWSMMMMTNSSNNNNAENLAELQMRRYKHLFTGNYHLDTQDAQVIGGGGGSSKQLPLPPLLSAYLQRYCRWKYLRWLLIFLLCTLLFFGFITYCLWLHDVSVARERHQQRKRLELSKQAAVAAEGMGVEMAADDIVGDEADEAQISNTAANSFEEEAAQRVDKSAEANDFATTNTIQATATTAANMHVDKAVALSEFSSDQQQQQEQHLQHESTILRAINLQAVLPAPKRDANKPTNEHNNKDNVKPTNSDDTTWESTTYASAAAAHILHYDVFNGHQNGFGLAVEEGRHIFRHFNNMFTDQHSTIGTSTKALTKVSPTIPPLKPYKPTQAVTTSYRSTATTVQDNGCYSTSLPMCQGVMDYDLTYNATIKLKFDDERALQRLIQSNCSARALEFICVTLEPECRPSHIGILPPCRRICKAVLEACSILIAPYDVLNELFDCGSYPDSSDPHKCEDPTRRHDRCNDYEFACYDNTCIPQQWQCDNIKDCATGEDEDECLVCDRQDEFRCRSNEKCIPEALRCDLKHDCFDGSDEEGCEDDFGSGGEGDDEDEESGAAASFHEFILNSFPHTFHAYASFLPLNQSADAADQQSEGGVYAYISATTDDENDTKFLLHEISNRTSGISTEEVTNSVPGDGPKGFFNFRDSKEIMMTSDTENKFKYSSAASSTTSKSRFTAANRSTTTAATTATPAYGSRNKLATTPLKPAASMRIAVTTEPATNRASSAAEAHSVNGEKSGNSAQSGNNAYSSGSNGDGTSNASKTPLLLNTCAPHQLRCVSGECITVDQLCDKKSDCPDGADELMCNYKEQRSSTTTTTTTTMRPITQPTIRATTSSQADRQRSATTTRAIITTKRNRRN